MESILVTTEWCAHSGRSRH